MPLQRSLSWSTALRDLHGDRARPQPGVIAAQAFVRMVGKARRLSLVTLGGFNRSAIMVLASAAAKAQQARTGESWATCIAAALKGAWAAAKAARSATAH